MLAATTAVRLNDRLAEAHSRLADVTFQYHGTGRRERSMPAARLN